MKDGKKPKTSIKQAHTEKAVHENQPPAPPEAPGLSDSSYNFSAYEDFPLSIEVFAADGTTIYINQAGMELVSMTDKSLLIGKYNLWQDPVCIAIAGREVLDRIFGGEAVEFPGFPAPIQDVYDRGVIEEKPWEAATMTLLFLPYWHGARFLYTVCIFDVKNTYKGQPKVIKAQEYIRRHWMEDFDLDKIAAAVNVGRRHLQRLFKEENIESPLDYYKRIKIERLQEKLLDPDLSIAEAFAACGIENGGTWFRSFKTLTGLSPSDYRKKHLKSDQA